MAEMGSVTYSEKRFFEWHEDNKSVSIRACSGSYGGGAKSLSVPEQSRSVVFNGSQMGSAATSLSRKTNSNELSEQIRDIITRGTSRLI